MQLSPELIKRIEQIALESAQRTTDQLTSVFLAAPKMIPEEEAEAILLGKKLTGYFIHGASKGECTMHIIDTTPQPKKKRKGYNGNTYYTHAARKTLCNRKIPYGARSSKVYRSGIDCKQCLNKVTANQYN